MLRELTQPTAALDTHLWRRLRADAPAPVPALGSGDRRARPKARRTRLTVFTLIGQVVYFRIGREAVMRRMGWTDIGAMRGRADRGGRSAAISTPSSPATGRERDMSFLCALPLMPRCLSRPAPPAAAARRRLCRGRICAARADRNRAGRDGRGASAATVSSRARRWRKLERRGRRDRGGPGRGGLAQAAGAACRPAARQAAGGDRRAGGGADSAKAQAAEAEARSDRAGDLLEARHRHAGRFRHRLDRAGDGQCAGRPGRRPISRSADLPARARDDQAADKQVEQAAAQRSNRRNGGCPSARLTAPSAGRINDVIRNPGEIAGPTAPVLSLLPDGAVKLKRLRARSRLSSLVRSATVLSVHCDGCRAA